MLGASDVPVCEDGVCAVPVAEQPSADQLSEEAPPR